jgi:valyl-tRNA synthetase
MVLKMEDLVKPIQSVLVDGDIKLHLLVLITHTHWLNNIRDWNISRQLWWGQQIPAYFYGDGKEDFVVAENIEDALKLAREKTSNSKRNKRFKTRC